MFLKKIYDNYFSIQFFIITIILYYHYFIISSKKTLAERGGFGPKFLIFKQRSKTFGILISGSQLDTCFVFKILSARLQWAAWDEKGQLWPENFDILDQKWIVCLGITIFFLQKGISPIRRELPWKNLPLRKTFRFWGRCHFLGLNPDFGRFGPVPNRYYKYP